MNETLFRCQICLSEGRFRPYQVREMMFGTRDEFQYFQCENCECLQLNDTPANLSQYYPENYYSFNVSHSGKYSGARGDIRKNHYRRSLLGSSFYKRYLGNRKFRIFSKLKLTNKSRVLDVGCGNGQGFLEPMAQAGFTNLLGCDPFLEGPIKYDSGLHIQDKEVFDMVGSWDLITYHHAFEHLPNPLKNLQMVHQLLTVNGSCVLRVPTVSSHAWEHYQENWVQLDAPRHFFLHSIKSMEILAEQAGMELFDVRYDSTALQFLGSERYQKDIPLTKRINRKGLVKWRYKFHKARLKRKSKVLNQAGRGDQAAFFLRKK